MKERQIQRIDNKGKRQRWNEITDFVLLIIQIVQIIRIVPFIPIIRIVNISIPIVSCGR